MSEPLCTTPDCKASNHCPICGVHHPVDDMVTWCVKHKG